MVAKISVGKNLYGALAYNQNKVDEGGAKILSTHLLRYPEDGCFRPDESMRQLLEWMPSHYRTEKPVIHISLNPHPDDILTDEQLAEIGREYMQRLGYGNRPILFSSTRTSTGTISTSFPCVSIVKAGKFLTSSSIAVAKRLPNFWNRNTAFIRRKVKRKVKSGS